MSDLSRFAHPDFWLPNQKPGVLLRPRQNHALAAGLIRAWCPNQTSDNELIAGATITRSSNFGGMQAPLGVPAFSFGSTGAVNTNGFVTDQNVPYGSNGTIIIRGYTNNSTSTDSPFFIDGAAGTSRTLIYRTPEVGNKYGWFLGGTVVVDAAGAGSIADLFDLGVPTTCAFTWTSGNVQNIYKNGVLAGASPYAKTPTVVAQTVRVGDRFAAVAGTTGLSGSIEYIYFYDRALSGDEIRAQFADPYCMLEPAEDWPEPGWSVAAGGGATYNQSCPATSAAVGALVRSTGKPLAISSAAVAALLRQIGKPVAAASTGSATLLRQTNKPLTASSTGSATLAAVRAFLLSLTASSTSAAALVRAVGKIVSATSASSGELSRQTGKPIAASSAGAAALIRATAKSLFASSAGSATLAAIRAVLLSLTASSTPVGTLARAIGKPITASTASAAMLVRATAKSLAATSAGGATLVKSIAKAFTAASSSLASLLATLLEGGVKVVTATATETLLVVATATDARVIRASASEAIV